MSPIYINSGINIKGGRVPLTEAQLREIFKRQDTNNDGSLDREELKNAFQSLGSRVPSWRVFRGLHRADKNGDGCISEEEMDNLVKYAFKLGYTIK